MKYTDTQIVFREVPDEISLAINISNCPNNCKGCHSPELWEDNGTELNEKVLNELIEKNSGITCVAFMGGDADFMRVIDLAEYVKIKGLKTAWYSGKDGLPDGWWLIGFMDIEEHATPILDYIKLGHWDEEAGPLDSQTTNQRMYKYNYEIEDYEDITYKFNGTK